MGLEGAFRIRALMDADTDGIVSLCDACSTVEAELGPITAAQWRAFIGRPRFAEGQDFRVAVKEGQIVGLVESSLRDQDGRGVRYIKVIVEPSYRRALVGTKLLAAILDQDSDDNVSIQGHVRQEWDTGKRFCQQKGFTVIESEYRMHCDAFRPASTYQGPAHINLLRDVEPCAARLAQVHNDAFRDDVSFSPHSPKDMLHKARGCRTWVAVVEGEIVAYAIIESEAGSIWLESLAVDPRFQGQGIGTALAVQGLRRKRSGANRPAGLSVSSKNPSALHIYRKMGFQVESEKLRYAIRRGDLSFALRRS